MKLTACFATLAMAEIVPHRDCFANGLEMPLENLFLHNVECDKKTFKCKPICKENAVINSNRKRLHCDKRGNEYRWKPLSSDIFPQCKSCPALVGLSSRVEVQGVPGVDPIFTISCPLGKSLSSKRSGHWMTSWVKFKCRCNKRVKACHWRFDNYGGKTTSHNAWTHQVELEQVKCVEAVENPPSTGLRLPPGLTCGRQAGTRIVDGQEAHPNTWPWMVRLEYDLDLLCGGVIVGENLVLTAGHCCATYDQIERVTGEVGSLNKGSGKMIEFKKKVMHPKYKEHLNGKAENDICLLFPTRENFLLSLFSFKLYRPNRIERRKH